MDCLLDQNSIKCRINEGCFFALGSHAGFKLEKVAQENDAGTDFHLVRQIMRNGKICDGGIIIDFQLKATQEWEDLNNSIKYALRSKSYNDIVTRNIEGNISLLLILMCLPQGEEDWIRVSHNEVQFRKSLYWYHTESLDLLENENSTKVIQVPKINVLNDASFKVIVEKFGIRQQT